MDPSMGPFMDAIGMLILFYLNLIGAKWIWSYLIGEGGGNVQIKRKPLRWYGNLLILLWIKVHYN